MTAAASMMNQAQFAATQPRQFQTSGANAQRATQVGKQFEAMFMTQMLNHMFTGLDQENGLFGGGHAEAMFRPMLLEEYGKMIANRGHGIGVADQVTRVMLSQQEV